jgi:hypothetical protein
LSDRHVEELMEERGVPVDHATIQRWVVQYSPLLEEAFQRRKCPVSVSWQMDKTYIKVKGQWRSLYRVVKGATRDHRLEAHRAPAPPVCPSASLAWRCDGHRATAALAVRRPIAWWPGEVLWTTTVH